MSPELACFVETMPPDKRERLADWGILDKTRVAAGKSLAEHLEDWKKALVAKGNGEEYVDLVSARAVFEGCGFKFWGEVCAERVQNCPNVQTRVPRR